jgi:hypothetical protein
MSSCRICGCTDVDCTWCVVLTGEPCSWTEPDLCSTCAGMGKTDEQRAKRRGRIAHDKAYARARGAPGAEALFAHRDRMLRVWARINVRRTRRAAT